MRGQLLPLEPIVQDHHTALHLNIAHAVNTADAAKSANVNSTADAIDTTYVVNIDDAITAAPAGTTFAAEFALHYR